MKIYGILITLSYVALFLAIFIISRVTKNIEINYKKQLLCIVLGNAFSIIIIHLLKDGSISSYFLQNVDEVQEICSQSIGVYLMISLILFSCFAAVFTLQKNPNSMNLLSKYKKNATIDESTCSVKLVDISDKKNV